ncbi:MAG: DNA-binding protein WhiA [Erysipelotrichaceae bacterium]|nr:DNA-binding protein WhiA [Erysipelotrichaceae bacterium]
MSFTTEVKAEIAANELHACCGRAQLSALIQMCASLSFTAAGMALEIKSENANTAKRILKLLKEHYQVSSQLSVLRKMKLKKNNIYVLRVNSQVTHILNDLQIMDEEGLRPHPKADLVAKECCARAYLAGAFLASGSINSPQTVNYHLEMSANSKEQADFLIQLMKRFAIIAKYIKRRKQDVIYVKASDKISDFLRCIGANEALFTFEDSRIQRDFMNSLTRLDNCELANEMKTISAGKKQLEDIAWLETYQGLDTLSGKLQSVAYLRKQYPEASLNELCEIYANEYHETISKSGMKHRLAKLKELANQYRNE